MTSVLDSEVRTDPLTRPVSALWVDDQPDAIRPLVPVVEEAGLRPAIITPVQISDPGDITAPVVIVDLRNELAGGDGVQICQRILAVQPTKPLIIISAFFGTERFAHLEHCLDPTARLIRIKKNTLEMAAGIHYSYDQETYERERRQARESVIAQIFTFLRTIDMDQEPPLPPLKFESPSLYALEMNDYDSLDIRARASLARTARIDAAERLTALFARRSDVDWLVINVPSGEVIQWGAGSPPTRQAEVRAFRRDVSTEGVPFVFSRDVSIDI